MSWEAIRGMTGESFIEWCERNDYDLSSDSARRLLVEAKTLLKEHDRAVEVLRLAKRAFARPLDLELFGEAGGAVWEFLHELEGSDGVQGGKEIGE